MTRQIVHELHDEPHLEGRRLTVRFIEEQVEGRGLDPWTVADRHDLEVADVYRALTYYHDNQDEMRTVEHQRRSAIDEHEHLTTDPDDVRQLPRLQTVSSGKSRDEWGEDAFRDAGEATFGDEDG